MKGQLEMPYSEKDHERALSRIYRDIESPPPLMVERRWPLAVSWILFTVGLAVLGAACATAGF